VQLVDLEDLKNTRFVNFGDPIWITVCPAASLFFPLSVWCCDHAKLTGDCVLCSSLKAVVIRITNLAV
jgi:hypothetical protein